MMQQQILSEKSENMIFLFYVFLVKQIETYSFNKTWTNIIPANIQYRAVCEQRYFNNLTLWQRCENAI